MWGASLGEKIMSYALTKITVFGALLFMGAFIAAYPAISRSNTGSVQPQTKLVSVELK